jgi:hypothetical protein
MMAPPTAGSSLRERRGVERGRAQAQQGAAEDDGQEAADDSQDTVGGQLGRMHEVIRRYPEQRFVAEDRAFDDDGGDGRDHGRADERCVEVADQLLEGEDHGRDRRVEGGRQGAGRADGQQFPVPVRRQSDPRPDRRCDTGADLHGRGGVHERAAVRIRHITEVGHGSCMVAERERRLTGNCFGLNVRRRVRQCLPKVRRRACRLSDLQE